MMVRAVGWGLPLVTLAVYLWMVLGPGQQLQAMTGGLLPPDLQPLGYDTRTLRLWLLALPPEGAALYLGPIAWLDTAFPVLMGLTLIWWMRPWTDLGAWVAVIVALAYVALDLAENGAVGAMVRTGVLGTDPAQIAAASALTQGKFLAFALAAVLAARRSWLRRRA